MSDQLSLFTMDLDTPVVSEPAPEVVIALGSRTAKDRCISLADQADDDGASE